MKTKFNDYLQTRCFEENPTVLDDDMPDFYDNWLSEIGVDLLMAYAEAWCAGEKLVEVKNVLAGVEEIFDK